MTDVRNSGVDSDNNAGPQFHEWQQIFENREIFLSWFLLKAIKYRAADFFIFFSFTIFSGPL
jgi:hypothetical protein